MFSLEEHTESLDTSGSNDVVARLSEAKARELLKTRAQVFAKPLKKEESLADFEAIVFNLSNEKYAFETQYIYHITPYGGSTKLPSAPELLLGIVNLRGQIVPLLNLHGFLGIPQSKQSAETRLIVLGKDRVEFAIVADDLDSVIKLDSRTLLECPDNIKSSRRRHILGICNSSLIVLNAKTLIGDARLFVGDQVE